MEDTDYWLENLSDSIESFEDFSKDTTTSYSISSNNESIMQHDEEHAINLRVQDTYDNLEDNESTSASDKVESSSVPESDPDDSTYNDESSLEGPSVPTAVDSGDFTLILRTHMKWTPSKIKLLTQMNWRIFQCKMSHTS